MGTDPGSEGCHGHPMILASPRLKPRSCFSVDRNRGKSRVPDGLPSAQRPGRYRWP